MVKGKLRSADKLEGGWIWVSIVTGLDWAREREREREREKRKWADNSQYQPHGERVREREGEGEEGKQVGHLCAL